MNHRFLFSAIILSLLTASANAQHHGDVEFGYDNLSSPGSIIIEEVETTRDGLLFFESEFEELDPNNPGDFSSDEPGFNTNAGENLLVLPGDQIWIRAVDASIHSAFGVGYVNYYNPNTDMLESFGRIGILDNSVGTADLLLNGSNIESGDNPQFIDMGDSSGEVHDHVIFDLQDDATAPLGAYGILFQLQSDLDPADGTMDLDSDMFWIVFNHGMSEEDFENFAVPKFTGVPEPGFAPLLIATTVLAFRRRRRVA